MGLDGSTFWEGGEGRGGDAGFEWTGSECTGSERAGARRRRSRVRQGEGLAGGVDVALETARRVLFSMEETEPKELSAVRKLRLREYQGWDRKAVR